MFRQEAGIVMKCLYYVLVIVTPSHYSHSCFEVHYPCNEIRSSTAS